MTHQIYNFHTDPGHGWIEVPMSELERLGIASKISPYSYRKDATAFLEEDCDFATFYQAKEELGELVEYKTIHTNSDSFVRRLQRFSGAR